MKKKHIPPKIFEFFLQRLVPFPEREALIGDFAEMYARISESHGTHMASCWYTLHILKLIPACLKNHIYWSLKMIMNYLKISFRNMKRHKGYSLINVSGLAIGLASSFLILLWVQNELSYDRFHENADKIYRVRNDRIYSDLVDGSAGCPPAVGPAMKEEFPEVLESARIYSIDWASSVVTSYSGDESPTSSGQKLAVFNQKKIFFAEPSFLKVFSFPLVAGSPEFALEKPNTALLSESSAKKYFGNTDPIGKFILVSNHFSGDQLCQVTGIIKDAPTNSHVKFEILLSYKTLIGVDDRAAYYWGWNAFNTYVLLSPTAEPDLLEAKLPQLVEKYDDPSEDYKRRLLLQPLADIHLYSHLRHEPEINGDAKSVYLLTIIAVFVLLIAWINYINLSTARSLTRAKEVGVKKVLGSQRFQIIKQFLFESAFINILTLIIALIIIAVALPYFNQITGRQFPFLMLSQIWPWILFSVIIGIFFSGSYPAFVLSSFDPVKVIKGKLHSSTKGFNLRKALVIFQFAISVFLLAATLVVTHQVSFMQQQDLGADIDQTLVVQIPRIERNMIDYKNRLKTELLRNPAIQAVTVSSRVPGTGYSNASSGIRAQRSNPEDGMRCFFIDVDYDFFDFYGIELIAGEKFTQRSEWNSVIILNEEAAKMLGFESPEKAAKQKVVLGGLGGQTVEVAGVIKNYHHKSLKSPMEPIIFNPLGLVLYSSIRISGQNVDQTIAQIRDTWSNVFPDSPFEYFFLNESFNNQYETDQQFGKIFGLFTMLAIFISCLGLFGLSSFTLMQRTKEIGVRKVLGASILDIMLLSYREFSQYIVLANLIALPIAWYGMSRWLQNFAYRISLGWGIFVLAGALSLIIAFLTVSFQAVKSATADPVKTLRYE